MSFLGNMQTHTDTTDSFSSSIFIMNDSWEKNNKSVKKNNMLIRSTTSLCRKKRKLTSKVLSSRLFCSSLNSCLQFRVRLGNTKDLSCQSSFYINITWKVRHCLGWQRHRWVMTLHSSVRMSIRETLLASRWSQFSMTIHYWT